MTGAFLRVKRDGKFENVEIEHLTDEERETKLANDPRLMSWLHLMCRELVRAEELFKELEADGVLQRGPSAVELREIVTELFEHREYAECWFPDYRGFEDAWGYARVGDCGNWDNCSDDCPIVKLRTAAGIKPTDHGGVEA